MSKVLSAAFHRNGVAGVPFYVGVVSDPFGEGDDSLFLIQHVPAEKMKGFVSDAVTTALKMDLLPDVAFGLNSWRGDRVLPEVLDEIVSAAKENHYIGRRPETGVAA